MTEEERIEAIEFHQLHSMIFEGDKSADRGRDTRVLRAYGELRMETTNHKARAAMKEIAILKPGLDIFEPIGRLSLTEEATAQITAGLLDGHQYRLEAVIEGDELVAMSFSPIAAVAKQHAKS